MYDRAPRRYEVRWLDPDGTELHRGEYAYGDDPEYTGEPPVKAPDEQGVYYFKGWSPEPGSVTADAEDSETWQPGIPVSCAVITGSGNTVPCVRERETVNGVSHERMRFIMPDEAAAIYTAKAPDVPPFGGAELNLPPAERIEASAFEGDTAVKSVYVPDGCAFIGDSAFRGCAGLEKIRVPQNCAFGQDVFAGCPALTAIYGPAGGTAEAWAIVNGIYPFLLISAAASLLIRSSPL